MEMEVGKEVATRGDGWDRRRRQRHKGVAIDGETERS